MGRALHLHRRRDGGGEVAVLTHPAPESAGVAAVGQAGPYRLFAFDCLASTSDEAMARLRAGDADGFLIVARRQSRGRGRHGRSWESPPGNLYASLALLDPAPAAIAPQLGFVVGLALAQTLRARLGGDPELQLKWPNDALYGGAKLAGLLVEGTTLPDGRLGCVAGVGVNCASHPQGIGATDLAKAGAVAINPMALLDEFAVRVAAGIALWRRGDGFATIRAGWMAFAAGLGGPIEVRTPLATLRGIFREIDARGRLLLETDRGEVRVEAGEVFLLHPT